MSNEKPDEVGVGRKRRGGLRVPSDDVPRPDQIDVAAPVPEPIGLAASISESFGVPSLDSDAGLDAVSGDVESSEAMLDELPTVVAETSASERSAHRALVAAAEAAAVEGDSKMKSSEENHLSDGDGIDPSRLYLDSVEAETVVKFKKIEPSQERALVNESARGEQNADVDTSNVDINIDEDAKSLSLKASVASPPAATSAEPASGDLDTVGESVDIPFDDVEETETSSLETIELERPLNSASESASEPAPEPALNSEISVESRSGPEQKKPRFKRALTMALDDRDMEEVRLEDRRAVSRQEPEGAVADPETCVEGASTDLAVVNQGAAVAAPSGRVTGAESLGSESPTADLASDEVVMGPEVEVLAKNPENLELVAPEHPVADVSSEAAATVVAVPGLQSNSEVSVAPTPASTPVPEVDEGVPEVRESGAESGEVLEDSELEEVTSSSAERADVERIPDVNASVDVDVSLDVDVSIDVDVSLDIDVSLDASLDESADVHVAEETSVPPIKKRADTAEPPPPPPRAAPSGPKKTPPKRTPAGAPLAKAPPMEKRRPPRKQWSDEMFNEDYLRTLPFLTPQATKFEANFVMESLAVDPGAQLLDVGCGYGRHAMELAARGYHLVGLDISEPLLSLGEAEAQRRGLEINFVREDMREMSFESQFDGAYCLFSTFGYFDDETNKRAAQNIAKALKPGARLVIEVLNRDYLVSDLPSRVWWDGDGCVVLEEVELNYFSSRIISKRSVVFEDGRQRQHEISLRCFSLHELGQFLHGVGLRVLEISGSMSTKGRFFGAHSRDIVVVAERRASKSAE